jgi:aromatic ring-opening dioxygenase catalytic subunit (LigB family)
MFPEPFDVPVVEVSIDESLDPEKHIAIGKALAPLGYFITKLHNYESNN